MTSRKVNWGCRRLLTTELLSVNITVRMAVVGEEEDDGMDGETWGKAKET